MSKQKAIEKGRGENEKQTQNEYDPYGQTAACVQYADVCGCMNDNGASSVCLCVCKQSLRDDERSCILLSYILHLQCVFSLLPVYRELAGNFILRFTSSLDVPSPCQRSIKHDCLIYFGIP